jgi:hypothetical protein
MPNGYPPGTCPVCLTPMDLALKEAGDKAHPLCAHPERRVHKDGCDFRGCGETAYVWPHGNYDLTHAKMMAPQRQWADLGIPMDKPEPAAARPKLERQPVMELEAVEAG